MILRLQELNWSQTIAIAIFTSPTKFLSNRSIIESDIIKEYLKCKKNKSIDQTVSKILNGKPFMFFKNEDGEWGLTNDGIELIKKFTA